MLQGLFFGFCWGNGPCSSILLVTKPCRQGLWALCRKEREDACIVLRAVLFLTPESFSLVTSYPKGQMSDTAQTQLTREFTSCRGVGAVSVYVNGFYIIEMKLRNPPLSLTPSDSGLRLETV
ncbi:hypothetical protein MHYP_G00293960 [Metynnis hypsauchen]